MDKTSSYERHEPEGRLLVVQVDHLSGEIIGDALPRLWEAGATNVQLVSTLAKKGRPGQLLLIDVGSRRLEAIEDVLLAELGVHGWHSLRTEHVHVATEIVERDIEVKTRTTVFRTRIAGKRRKNGTEVMPEYSSCAALRGRLETEGGVRVPLRELIILVRNALNQPESGDIDLRDHAGGT